MMNKTHPFIQCVAFAVLLSAAAACSQPSRSLTVVTGKVIYGTLAMEGAELKVFKMENGEWRMMDSSRSGYHGSFRLHLPKGTYRIEASTILRSGELTRKLSGNLEPLVIEGRKGRMDQVLIELGEESQG